MTKKPRYFSRGVVILLALGLWSTSSLAQSGGDDRYVLFAPYLWGTSIEGTSTVGALPPLEIDASFSDLLSNLNFALSLHTEFVSNNWIFTIDPTYLSLEMDVELPSSIPAPSGTALKNEVEVWLVEGWVGYRITEKWDAIGGVRYQSQDITLSGLPSPPLPVSSAGISESWSDWFVGARFKTDLGAKWILAMRADVTFAGDSDTSWNAEVYFNRRFGESMALNLGYRYFVDDYNNPNVYHWDVTQQGPVVGYTWVF